MFYSPADQLLEEQGRMLRATEPSTQQNDNDIDNNNDNDNDDDGATLYADREPKRIRLSYEGEPDTTKWAIPPAPDIFARPQGATTDSVAPGLHNIQPVVEAGGIEPLRLHQPQPPAMAAAAAAAYAEDARPHVLFEHERIDNIRLLADELNLGPEVLGRIEALCAAQNDFERRLYEHRKRIQHGQAVAVRNLEAREIIAPIPAHEREAMAQQHAMELNRADKRSVGKLDELRYQQQLEIQKLGVPGFYPSSNPSVLKQQQDTLKILLNKGTAG
ncbi:hypothetical protein H4217_007503 [Coemansia sp. RSA 1939]|nr:hypothetical protein H4217_007503 [Coemansia sp. RSA 1939]KAJ2598215.1 hypothetical protein EV177_007572 [Coemansia sp. RSA 1804]KAJ2685724.1 hypothetical protein GGH99_003680 [Coemansia sp. RSA 1285]